VTILIVTPAARGARSGNRVTALRWAAHLRALGHRVQLAERWRGAPCDLLIALHATRSAPSVARLRAERPGTPIVVALTGTDVYEDRLASDAARASLAAAWRILVLQASAIDALPPGDRARSRVIVQSARAVTPSPAPPGTFQVCVLAHLRAVKDPLLAAAATRLLPAASRVRVVHLGRALDPGSAERARSEASDNPRYEWRGERPRREALRTLAGSQALLVTSRLEGGANVVSEAVAAGVPVLSTHIDGTIGLLGPSYPGYFPVGDADALAAILARLETDASFRAQLQAHIDRVRPLVDPGRERAAWEALLRELTSRLQS
jgi:putative glycosyltransferase (TIGR04348 family)